MTGHSVLAVVFLVMGITIGTIAGHFHGKAQVLEGLLGSMTKTMEELK